MIGKFIDMTVTLPAATAAVSGTVLGEITTTHALTPYTSTAKDGSNIPCYILTQDIKNDKVASLELEEEDDGSADIPAVRVLAMGEIPDNEVILSSTSDKLADIVTALKNNGILVINAQKCVERIGD